MGSTRVDSAVSAVMRMRVIFQPPIRAAKPITLPGEPALCRRSAAEAVDRHGFSHFVSFEVARRRCGAKSLRGGVFVRVADVVIDEVGETIAGPRNRAAIGRDEPQRVVGLLHDAEPAFVMQPMVIRAEQRQVLGLRLAAVDPVLYVMAVEIAFAMTTRERATTITSVERSAQR